MVVCRKCGEGAENDAEIVHDLDCPTWDLSTDGDVFDWADEVDSYEDIPIIDRHADCTHKRRARPDQECDRSRRQLRAAQRALGGL